MLVDAGYGCGVSGFAGEPAWILARRRVLAHRLPPCRAFPLFHPQPSLQATVSGGDCQSSAIGKKLHHYVPRFFSSRAWAEKDKVYCLQPRRNPRPNVRNVCAGLISTAPELSPTTWYSSGKLWFGTQPGALKASHRTTSERFAAPGVWKSEGSMAWGLRRSRPWRRWTRAMIELDGNFHLNMEEAFRAPYLAAMISGSLDFLPKRREEAAGFYQGLVVQYARTNHIKQTRIVMAPERLRSVSTRGESACSYRGNQRGPGPRPPQADTRSRFLDNTTRVPFVTADQPVINIAAGPKDTARRKDSSCTILSLQQGLCSSWNHQAPSSRMARSCQRITFTSTICVWPRIPIVRSSPTRHRS